MSTKETVELRGRETIPLEEIGEGNLFPVVGLRLGLGLGLGLIWGSGEFC